MDAVLLVLDRRPGYLQGAPDGVSLLSLPAGDTTLLHLVALMTQEIRPREILVLPSFAPTSEYEATVLRAGPRGTRLLDPERVGAFVQGHEPSDVLMVVDPRYWPIDGFDIATVTSHKSDARWAAHAVAVGSPVDQAREFVHCDDQGMIRRISRYYDQVTNSRIDAIAYSVIPFASLSGSRFDSLADMRAALSAWGVLSRDVPIASAIVDLSEEHGYLTLNEHLALQAAAAAVPRPGFERRGESLVAHDAQVDADARLIGPVVIQSGVRVRGGATLVGPAVLGRNSTVESGGLVAHSVLTGGVTVPGGGVVRQRVLVSGAPSGALSAQSDVQTPFDGQDVRLGADASVMRDMDRRRSIYPAVKLALDVAVALVSLVVLAPLLAVIAVLVRLDSPGSAMFGHLREGRRGKLFRCWKFRTMVADAHLKQRELYSTNAVDGPQFKLHNDPRVTRVGAWLRATNLDELPQLFNILVGQMSLVGPRPSPFRENQICVPWRRARLSVRPGITGLWQICRDQRSEGDFHQWIAYDIMYVRHLSLLLDVKILIATLLTLGGMWSVKSSWMIRDDHAAMDEARVPRKSGRSEAAVPGS